MVGFKTVELDEVDFQIIVALSTQMTQEEAGQWVDTPSLPSGLTSRAIRARMQVKKNAYERLLGKISSRLSQQRTQYEEITKEKYREKLAQLRSKGLAVKEKALDRGIDGTGDLSLAVKVAESIEERDFGKASQVHKHEGDVNVNHKMIWQGRTALIEQEKDIIQSEKLLSAVPEDALEAELVESN